MGSHRPFFKRPWRHHNYDEYQYCIEDVLDTSTDKTKSFVLVINKNGEQTTLTLNESTAKFAERVDNESEESYYKLQKGGSKKDVMLIRYRGTNEQSEIESSEQVKKQLKRIPIKC